MQGDQQEVHLRDYWRVVLKRRWTVLSVFVILVSTATIATFTMKPVYRSSAQLLIERENPNVVSIEDVLAVDAASTDYYQTQYEILKSENLARRVIHKLDLGHRREFVSGTSGGWRSLFSPAAESAAPEPDPEAQERHLIGAFQGRLQVTPKRNSRLVTVSFDSLDPRLSAEAVNTLAEEYIQYSIETKISASREARTWLDLQVEEMREKVRKAEEAFEDFKQTIPQRIMARVASSTATGEMENRPEVVNSPFIQELRAEEIKLSAKLAEISKKYGPKHPQIIQLTSQLDTLRERMGREIKRVVAAVLIEESPEYLLLKREAEANRHLYEVLLTRLKETTVTENLPQSNIVIVDQAQVPEFPVRPRKRTNVLLSIVLGLACGIGLAFFFEYLNNTIEGPEDIDRLLRVPFLGAVPAVRKPRADRPVETMMIHSSHSPQAEAYRTIRTGLRLALADRQPRVILVTSPAPFDGKTTTSTNLAIAMAQAGSSVLLMDGDLRKPSIHQFFDLDNGKGLSSILIGEGSIENTIRQTSTPLLSLLSTGPLPPNPAELLGSQRMKDFIAGISDRFDRIVIDSAPLMPVADSILLAMLADGVVLVVKESATRRDIAVNACRRLAESNAKILGAVLNNVDMKHGGYYFYPYYRYSHAENDSQASGSRPA